MEFTSMTTEWFLTAMMMKPWIKILGFATVVVRMSNKLLTPNTAIHTPILKNVMES